MSVLAKHQTTTLESLHVCSIKQDPTTYPVYHVPSDKILMLTNLRELGIDYDYLTSAMMCALSQPGRLSLYKLFLNVHRLDPNEEPLSNNLWAKLVETAPSLKVTLNFIHSIEGAWHIMDVLRPSMPVAHIRLIFSQYVNGDALIHLSRYSSQTLESVYIVDSINNSQPCMYSMTGDEDPFVMLAWKCHNLKKITILGKLHSFQTSKEMII